MFATLPDFHATEDHNQEEEAVRIVDSFAKKHLRLGMTQTEVRCVMGKPEIEDKKDARRVAVWTYLVSISGTWTYSTIFLDGRLQYFGTVNPQWLGDELPEVCVRYDPPELKKIRQVCREERRAAPIGSANAASPRR